MTDHIIHKQAAWTIRLPNIRHALGHALGVLGRGIDDMNRYADAASLVAKAEPHDDDRSRRSPLSWL